MDELRWASAREQRRLLRSGAVHPDELRATVAEAVERLDPQLHAVVIPLLDRPGDGVPVLVKDAGQELDGTPHWVGVAALRDAGARSRTTTGLVRRLEATGFPVVGRTACPQLSAGVTTEPAGFEPTRNPWDPTRSAGGSSGGSAAAVASGMVAVAHGSDATGSLRCPAALCGVATLVPTAGRVAGVAPAGQPPDDAWRDFVVARHATDLSLLLEALTGAGPVRATGPLRVGLLDHDPELGMAIHPACAAGVHLAGGMLELLGHHVELAWPPGLDDLWGRVGGALTVVSDATRPPVLRWVGERLGRPVRRGELDDRVFDAADRADARTDAEVAGARSAVTAAVATLPPWWADHDVLVTPTTFQPAWPLGGDPGPREMGTLLAPFSLTGQPALSLPLHHTDDGLPIGVHLVGRHGADEVLARLAEDLQGVSDWTARRPPIS